MDNDATSYIIWLNSCSAQRFPVDEYFVMACWSSNNKFKFMNKKQDKQIRYTPRKPKNDVRKRGNG
ncbi:hypothetical protein NC653_021136 [Populus alba x Populus x berolinensis]|uniref:Uncharacterized protein n=1 Tax=Populus alba x Populus x berolinensis TaxID=444605 RepID=A0AAD6QDQ0_9ROSI|nr:hypothetical protein NC653_019821 [Populus alba x Populus x berolinensis]KAJ6988114.1 hypothetical protein NC653_021136 [Populus alba x Populus x berolinensis]